MKPLNKAGLLKQNSLALKLTLSDVKVNGTLALKECLPPVISSNSKRMHSQGKRI